MAATPNDAEAEEQLDPVRLSQRQVRRRNVRDLGMLVLGLVSLGIIVYDFLFRASLRPADIVLLEWVDLGIVAVFVAEFTYRWRSHGWSARFVARNWFDVLGMVPMMATNIPLFRAFRLLRIGIVASRLLRMWAYVTGQKSAQVVFDRYRQALVDEVTDRVMLRAIAMAEGVVVSGAYARAVGDSLAARRDELGAMAVEASKANDLGRWFAMVPGFEAAVRQAALTGVDTAAAALRSPEMRKTLEDMLGSVFAQAREEVGARSPKVRSRLAEGP